LKTITEKSFDKCGGTFHKHVEILMERERERERYELEIVEERLRDERSIRSEATSINMVSLSNHFTNIRSVMVGLKTYVLIKIDNFLFPFRKLIIKIFINLFLCLCLIRVHFLSMNLYVYLLINTSNFLFSFCKTIT